MLKLPRPVETDPRREAIERALTADERPIWSGGAIRVPHVAWTGALEEALRTALVADQLDRGLEHIEQRLIREAKGLQAARDKQGTAAANRLSRILVMADDGAERFYRQCEQLLRHHGDRLVGLHVGVPSKRLSEKLFGADELVKAVLVSDRDAVVNVLFALATP